MERFELHRFEDSLFYVMSGYADNLESLYGNYMKLPSEKDRISHDYNKYYWRQIENYVIGQYYNDMNV